MRLKTCTTRLGKVLKTGVSWCALCAILVAVPGCPPHPPPTPEPRPAPAPPPPPPPKPAPIPPKPDPVVKPDVEPLPGQLSDAEKQDIGRRALFDLQRMVISSAEVMELSTGAEPTSVAADVLKTKLAELGYRVTQTTRGLPFEPSETQLDALREQGDFNLAFLIAGGARERDRFGNFWSFKSDLRGKVLNLTTHQSIAEKTFRKQGRRALDEDEAARDALESAAADLATYLTDEVSRKWEATSLIRVRLICTDLDHAREVDDVRIGLQRRPGIYYVSLESWDKRSDRAVFEVLCRYDVREYLVGYVDELRLGRIKVERVERGKVIMADQDLRGR